MTSPVQLVTTELMRVSGGPDAASWNRIRPIAGTGAPGMSTAEARRPTSGCADRLELRRQKSLRFAFCRDFAAERSPRIFRTVFKYRIRPLIRHEPEHASINELTAI